ncbi:MAG: crossover junction endodeoxyribonuclease RuvC [Gemmatimonadota bacterium]|nr:crossover junction endodeoxyribonuclease RuvC [Gemmatimonadota bacterium]
MSFRVLGIDPGTAVTGFGVVEPAPDRVGRLIECGVIRTKSRDPLATRLSVLHDGVSELIRRHEPSVLALESLFYAKNVRTTVTLGHARGVILLAAGQAEIEVAEFPPATVKKCIVGRGGAAKAQVSYMVQRLLNLASEPSPSDASDGIALALTYLVTRRRCA